MYIYNYRHYTEYEHSSDRGYSFGGSVNSTNFLVANGLVKDIPSFLLSCVPIIRPIGNDGGVLVSAGQGEENNPSSISSKSSTNNRILLILKC